ncbi:hypothetical protein SteCoe_22271 [Stentor coeruleus]|uniref:PPM-type phosphatase domain-containing protein n=1 Tax=Stentor coeruleus TaxID=5963 RepID=A0A1R2BMP6_9CILI|nr:hypothetical protein SteCoe_22271 [Stentor coeruleus]
MGNCCKSVQEPPSEFEYILEHHLKMTNVSAFGSILGSHMINLTLTNPINQLILNTPIGPRYMKITGCILPGIDPKGEEKHCQDNYTFLALHGSLYCMLFDGHGTEGHHASKFCLDYVEKYVRHNHDEFLSNPKQTIIACLEECDKELSASSVDCELSGSTGILLFIHENAIHTGCLGDSRAVLGTLTDSMFPFNPSTNSYARNYPVTRMLKPIPLTTDQKPDNTEEIVRIRKSGGIVEKFKDSFSPNGHYRVCLPECGGGSALAMTRSLGDKVAKKFGVSSIPVYQYFSMYSSQDQYIVLASDGIWDVMDNMEVMNFLEMWRGRCSEFAGADFPANNKNSTLARMLAEESRYRWFAHVQAEGAVIDDISCIVIDFSKITESLYGSMVGAESMSRVSKGFKHLGD